MPTRFTTCSLCEAMCGLAIDLEGDRITSIRGDADDPFSRGHICPKAPALKDIHEDPDRLRRPLRRTDGGWEEISWDVALDEAALGIHGVQERHGLDSVATYLGNPTVHNAGALLFAPIFLKTLRSKNRFSASSVDQLPHMLVAYLMFGHRLLMPVADVDRSHYFLVLGANPVASNGSLMTAPDLKARLAAVRQRGGKVVVLDPRRTETAAIADEHVFIRPGTDAFFLLAVLNEAFARGPRLGHLESMTTGRGELRAAIAGYSPEQVEGITGIPAGVIRRIAAELLAAPSAVAYGRFGTSTQAFGSVCQWLINALNAVTGNLDREGGAMFTRPAFDLVNGPEALAAGPGSFGRWKSSIRGLPEFGGELPVAALGEEMAAGKIRALFTSAGNPVLSTPNGAQLDRALASVEFMVSIDPYLNETTRHARIVLPPASALERSHYDVAFHGHAVRNTAKYALPIFPKPPFAKHEWEIFAALTDRLERLRGKSVFASSRMTLAALRQLEPDGLIDLGLRFGPYGAGANPFKQGLDLSSLRRAPHGVDLGPLVPCLVERLKTADRKIHLAPPELVGDLQRVRSTLAEAPPRSLLLVGRRHLRDNNSWMHNVPKLMAGRPRCTLMVHPDDARARGLTDGAPAVVRSRVGHVTVPVEVTDDVMRGVVSLPHGYGHGRPGTQQRIAAAYPGISVNDVTDELAIDALSGNAAFSATPVEVEAAGD